MKRLTLFTKIVLFSMVVCLWTCEPKNDIQPDIQGILLIGFESPGTDLNDGRISADEKLSVVVTIENNLGEVILDQEILKLTKVKKEYVTKPISLVSGQYKLTDFLVINDIDEAIYMTPKENSPLAYLVEDPTPISINVISNETTKLIPMVITTERKSPKDFGYESFSFQYVETFDFLLAVFSFNYENSQYELTDANIQVLADGTEVLDSTLVAGTNQLTLPSNYNEYELVIQKSGWEPYSSTHTEDDLLLHFSDEDLGPLQIYLDEGLWEYTYGGSSRDMATSLSSTVDGGYILTGDAESSDGDVDDGPGTWIVKLDRFGTIEWSKSYPGYIGNLDIIQTQDGGYVTTGNDGTIKLDAMGEMEFSVGYGGIDIIECADLDYLVVGGSTATEISKNGYVNWSTTLDFFDAKCVVEDLVGDGGYVIGGTETYGDSEFWKVSVLKMNYSRVMQWQYNYDESTGWDEATAIIQHSDGGYLMACSFFRVMRIGEDGSFLWSKYERPNDFTIGGANSIISYNNDFIVSGFLWNHEGDDTGYPNQPDGWVVRIDENGNQLWGSYVGGPNDDEIVDASIDFTGKLAVGGYQVVNPDFNMTDIDYWVKKISIE